MKVKVRLLAHHRELAGSGERLVELPEGATVGDMLDEVIRSSPRLAGHRDEMLVSVNKKQAPTKQVLREGDEAVLLPPAVGG